VIAEVRWVAVGGLGLSIVSLSWQAVTALLSRPRLLVGVERRAEPSHIGAIRVRDSVRITVRVENLGRRTMTVSDLGVAGRTGERASVASWRSDHYLVEGPDLPAPLEPGATAIWVLPDEATASYTEPVEWRAWASRWRGAKRSKMYYSTDRVGREDEGAGS
jgi:hypothetical protein